MGEVGSLFARPLKEFLTPEEYDLFLRFGVGPKEVPTDEEKVVFAAVQDKVWAEGERARRAFGSFIVVCSEAVVRHEKGSG